jgi:23S rRNA (guanosine2251-2'-O)-methyltransferase
METNLARAIALAKDAGALVLGTAFDGRPPSEFDLSGPTMIVVGSEGKGLRPSTESACDAIVTIPMMGITASLNASVAASVVLYEALRQRLSDNR